MALISKWRRWRIWPLTLAALGFTAFVIGTLHLQRLDFLQPVGRSTFHLASEKLLLQPSESTLINLHDFRYLINNDVCSGNNVYILTFVHSAPSDFSARNAIRDTWGGLRNIGNYQLRTIFLLGTTSPSIQKLVEKENGIHHDLVQGNFVDTYANLTYKHIMGHKWVSTFCNGTKFVLKTDEDVFIDMQQFVHYLRTLYGELSSPRTLICNMYPIGTPTRREGKWNVSVSEYPFGAYPCYCAGLAYVVTPDVSKSLNAASLHVPFFWIDDVYVTGFLAEALHIRHLSLNFRVTMNVDSIKEWLQSNSSYPSPYLIVGIGDVPAWTRLLRVLWDKTITTAVNYGY